MTTPTLLAWILLAAAPSLRAAPPAPGAGPGSDDAAAWRVEHVKLGAYAGAFDGMKVRRDSGGLALLEAAATPVLKGGAWKLELPVRLRHRQTFGASLSETEGAASAVVENRVAKALRLGATGGLSGAWRPGWPDLYQPDVNLALAPTDRYSFLAWQAGVSLWATPFPRNHLRLKYHYIHYAYVRDPNFDEARNPMHLTPRDNGQHVVEGSFRRIADGYAVALRFDWARRLDEVYLARNAVDGKTGLYTNPPQRLDRMEPSVEVELRRLGGRLEVSLQLGYQLQDDRWQGYYSYAGPHPRVIVDYAFTDRLSGRLRGEAWLRTYGPDSKAAGLQPGTIGHLESGTRLYDRRSALAGTVSYALTSGLHAKVTGEWVKRDSNYPDYVPGRYPSATTLYDIEWSYANTLVLAGVELRI